MIKKVIKKIFKSLGYNLVKIQAPQKSVLPNKYEVKSPIQHNTNTNMDAFFSDNDNLNSYVNGRKPFYELLASEIIKISEPSSISKIADVGCGPGDLLNILKDNFSNHDLEYELQGFDHSEKLISIASSRFPRVKFDLFNVYEDHKMYKQQFDIVICSEVVEHLLSPDEAIINLLSILKKAGILVLTVPNGRVDTYLGHINFWSPESWNQYIKKIAENNSAELIKVKILELKGAQYNFAAIKIIK